MGTRVLRTPAERERARRSAGAVVYFVVAEGQPEFVKIGWAVDPLQRLSELQTGNPRVLRLVGTLLGGRDLETHLHRRFSAYRLRPDSEWFRLCGELAEFVAGVRAGGRVGTGGG